MSKDLEFWKAHGGVGLIWSNPDADDDTMISKALLPDPPHTASISEHFSILRKAYELDEAKKKLTHL